jgi:hypothetical protein
MIFFLNSYDFTVNTWNLVFYLYSKYTPTMICWRCHSNSVNTGSSLPNISDVKTWKDGTWWELTWFDTTVFTEPYQVFVYMLLTFKLLKLNISVFTFCFVLARFLLHSEVESCQFPPCSVFSCLDVWNVRQTTSGVYAITVTTSTYHSRRGGRL